MLKGLGFRHTRWAVHLGDKYTGIHYSSHSAFVYFSFLRNTARHEEVSWGPDNAVYTQLNEDPGLRRTRKALQ